MAIYHLSVSNVSRASGSRATATLSYITGKRVHDERRGETYDYGRKERVLRVGTLLPEGAPAEFADPAVLFNAVELHETGRTARPAKKIVVALPREFTPRQRVQALEEYIRENLNADATRPPTPSTRTGRATIRTRTSSSPTGRSTRPRAAGPGSSSAWSTCWTSGASGFR